MKPNEIYIILVIIFGVVVPLLKKVIQAVREHAAKREAALRREREEMERLRTGRDPTSNERSAMETMSQRASEPAANRPVMTGVDETGGPVVRTRTIRLPGGIVLEVPEEETTAPGPRRSPSPEASGEVQARSPKPMRGPEPVGPPAGRREKSGKGRGSSKRSSGSPVSVDRFAAAAAAGAVSSASHLGSGGAADASRAAGTKAAIGTREAMPAARLMGQPLGVADLKKAFVLNEVLGRPVSER